MGWLPFAAAVFAACILWANWWWMSAAAKRAREQAPTRIVVTGSRGKSGTVRLIHSVLTHSGMPTYAKITGAIAEELRTDSESFYTRRIGPISATEMLPALVRAQRDKARAIVFECMAVAPKLIAFVINEVVKPEIVVIPTIRLDHLEDEGHSLEQITRSIVTPLQGFHTLVTGDTDIRVLETLRVLAREKDFHLIEARVSDAQPEVLEHHPVNVAVALAVATQVGVPHEVARGAILGASREPNAGIGWWLSDESHEAFICDLGSANDVQSAAEAVAGIRAYLGDDVPLIPVIVNRWDRPLRGLSFAAAASLTSGSVPVVLSGDAYPHSRRVMQRVSQGQATINRLPLLGTITIGSVRRLVRSWQGNEPTIGILLLENIHSNAVRNLRARVTRHGRQVFHDRTKGA